MEIENAETNVNAAAVEITVFGKVVFLRLIIVINNGGNNNKNSGNNDNNDHYTFKLNSRSLLVNILQLILQVRQLWIIGWGAQKRCYWTLMTSLPQSARKLQNNKILKD